MIHGTITGRVQHMAAADVLAMIPQATRDAISARDAHPEYRAYCIAHEGEAQGNLVGFGKAVIQYFRDVVGRIYDRLTAGTPLYRGHNADNSARQPIGEIVGKGKAQVDGKDAVVAAVYIAPEARAEKLDVCSIEANIVFTDAGGGHARAVDVERITGIALGDSQNDTPGFPGATLLAALQAFVKTEKTTMDKAEIIAGIKELKLTPADLFDAAVLAEDKAVAKIVEDATVKERGFGTRMNEKVEKLTQKLSEQEAAHAEALKAAQGEAVRAKSRSVLDGLVTERKLDDAQKKFVERSWKTFETKASDEEGLKGDLNRFLDAQIADHRSLATEIFGVKGDDKKGVETPSGDDAKLGPGNNPLIPA